MNYDKSECKSGLLTQEQKYNGKNIWSDIMERLIEEQNLLSKVETVNAMEDPFLYLNGK